MIVLLVEQKGCRCKQSRVMATKLLHFRIFYGVDEDG
jgi:hypothetical protein